MCNKKRENGDTKDFDLNNWNDGVVLTEKKQSEIRLYSALNFSAAIICIVSTSHFNHPLPQLFPEPFHH